MTEIFKMPAANGKGTELQIYEKLILANLKGMDAEKGLCFAKSFTFKPSDIILCSYPKCGYHWMNNMIWRLKSHDTSKQPMDTTLEYIQPEALGAQEEPRVLHTHLKPVHIPHIQQHVKSVVLFRNPKDVLVSDFYYLRNSAANCNGQTFEEFYQSFMSGYVPHGSYFEYLRQLDNALSDIGNNASGAKTEVFYFEDFVLDPANSLKRLNAYLDFQRDDEYLKNVLRATTMDALKQQDLSDNSHVHFSVKDKEGNSVIYRKGKIGDWRNHLTIGQREQIDDVLRDLQLRNIQIKYDM